MTQLSQARPALRTAAISLVVALLVAGTLAVAWQLALARVPQHRATLERLIQAHTGLDVRFNELGLRWGWYGPEAVFREVELGEPGGSSTLLRAPELTVGFDAWRTMQSGQLRAGRVTLVAPEIDLVRTASPGPRRREGVQRDYLRALARWQGGRIDVESATLRLPLGRGSVALRVPRGSVRRAGDAWTVNAQLLLPERLGRVARLSMNLEGDPARRQSLSGRVHFDGKRLSFPGWRELLSGYTSHARHLPAAGHGNVELRATLAEGAPVRVSGEIAADEVRIVTTPAPLRVGYLSGSWSVVRRERGWRLDVRDLRAGPNGREATPAALALDLDPVAASAHAAVDLAPLELLASAAQAMLPQVPLEALDLTGIAQDLELDWNGREPRGARLQASAEVTSVGIAVPERGFVLSGGRARLAASDATLEVDLDAPAARVELGGTHSPHWTGVRLAARVFARARERGWEIATERLIAEHADGRLSLAGEITGDGESAPRVALRASVSNASLDAVRDALFARADDDPGVERLPRLARGRIERGDFELTGPLGASPIDPATERFRGSLVIRDAALSAHQTWPAFEAVDAEVTWTGPQFRAAVSSASAAGARVSAGEASWRADGSGPVEASGRAYGRLEQGLAWLRSQEALHAPARNLHELEARGDALLDFAVTIPAGAEKDGEVRLALSLEGARVQPAPGVPALEGLRGALVLEAGRLRRTTLTGRWLGGPVSIRVGERATGSAAAVTELTAQGLIDAASAARAVGLADAQRLTGRTAWQGRLAIAADASLAGHAETTLEGIASEWPDPLGKPASGSAPVRIEIEAPTDGSPELRIIAADRFQGRFALTQASRGWQVERGSLRIGPGDAMLPAAPALVLAGRVARLDLPAWLAIGRESSRGAQRPDLWTEIAADEVAIAGRSFTNVELAVREDEESLYLRIASPALEGTLTVPRDAASGRAMEIALARLDIPAVSTTGELASLVASLAPAARLSAENLTWEGRTLGRLDAALRSDEEGVRVESLRLVGAAHELAGDARCGAALESCRLALEVASSDAAQTLRDFGFADDLDAARARLAADLDWRRASDRPWLASLSGHVGMSLERGSVRGTQAGGATPFALLAIPALLSQDTNGAGALEFRRLQGDYTLRDGQAVTSNLHLDGEAEILARGRVGLVDRDYEQVAWILEGEERLPAAVRRFGATPRMAAAWLQLRDFFGGPEIEESRAILHLHGSWLRPIVGAPREEESSR